MHPIRRVAPIQLNRLTLIAGVALSACLSGPSSAENAALVDQNDLSFESYSVYVAEEKAYARCGPATDYYRTDPLRQGQALEVYAETDDGWLGIRPPKESFCWVPADTIEMAGSKEDGTVIEDRTVAWIGTHLGRARTYRWQVQLAKGEPVTVIGRSEREGPDGPQLWFRIVPPSGEYRWVHRDDVVGSSEELVELMRSRPQNAPTEVKVFPLDSPRRQSDTETTSRRSEEFNRVAGNDPPSTAASDRGPNRVRQASHTTASDSGNSVPEDRGEDLVGSGLNNDWKADDQDSRPADRNIRTTSHNNVEHDAVRSVDSMGRPRLLEINADPSAPSATERAVDSNWVAGSTRGSGVVQSSLGSPSVNGARGMADGTIMRTSAQMPTPMSPPNGGAAAMPKRLTVVSSERIAQVELETRDADIDRLGLVFSRLMAAQASAAETEPVARAARGLAATSPDPVVAGRARLLAERVEQYRRVAQRRDGEAVIRSNDTPVIPVSQTVPIPTSNAGPLYNGAAQGALPPQASSETGYLVQVYSARANSPPFALTDHSGRTIAYVTPSPGVNLRAHLNSRVNVFGNRGYLTGLNTPHILATQAVRTQE